jgi:hypothetical protein
MPGSAGIVERQRVAPLRQGRKDANIHCIRNQCPGEAKTMRAMLTYSIPVARGNQAAKDGSIDKTIKALNEMLNPEAAYFSLFEGKRGGMLFFDLAESAKVVEIAELLFANLDAEVEIIPVMNAEDLRKGITAARSS